MDNTIKRLHIGIFLFLCVAYCIREFDHPDIDIGIKPYADNGSVIDGIFKPELALGQGCYAVVWKGLLYQNKTIENDSSKTEIDDRKDNCISMNKKKSASSTFSIRTSFLRKRHIINKSEILNENSNWKPIAMKIVTNAPGFKQESNIYRKLLAYKNETVERYGITAVWYIGDLLKKFHAIGMTLCTASLTVKLKQNGGKLRPIDRMVVLYQAVVALKYIHSRGVCQRDLKLDNLMVKGAQLYVIDFNEAKLISDVICESRMPIWGHYLIDLKKMIVIIIQLSGIEVSDFMIFFDDLRMLEYCKKVGHKLIRKLLLDYYDEITKLSKIKDDDDKTFDYDAMGNKILDVIKDLSKGLMRNGTRYPLFSWLSEDEKLQAKKNFISIESVPRPQPIFDV